MAEIPKMQDNSSNLIGLCSTSITESSNGTAREILDDESKRSNILRQWEPCTSKPIVIWFDPTFGETEESYRDAVEQLRRLVNTLQLFSDNDQCLDFITNISTDRLFFILSHHISENFVLLIHDFVQTDSIYILLEDKTQTEKWMSQYPKIRNITTSISMIIDEFRLLSPYYQSDFRSTPCLPLTSSELDTDELNQSFMYSVLLKEILLKIDYDDKAKSNFFNLYKEKSSRYPIHTHGLEEMDKFYHQHSPIWWYIKNSFIYSVLNNALRTDDIRTILKMGFYLKDLHQQIEHVYANTEPVQPIVLYRGQGISVEELEKIKKNIGGLLSFNNFLSTTSDHRIAYSFAESVHNDSTIVGILFKIEIDPEKSRTPFALLDRISECSDASDEVLFSMNTVFRIVDVQRIGDCLWTASLVLTSDTDTRLELLTNRMREEIRGPSPLHQLGLLLIRMGHFDEAEDIYNNLLGMVSAIDSNERARIYSELGYIFYEKGNLDVALKYLENALDIKRSILSTNHHDLASTYDNIGSVHQKMGHYEKALSYYHQALEIREQSFVENDPQLASTLNNIGLVYSTIGEYSKALSYYEKTLCIQEKILPKNHPDLSITYNNTGLLYDQMGDYSKALLYYEKTLDIREKVLPSSHPLMASIYNNIASVHQAMGDYLRARLYSEKTLEVQLEILPINHPNLAATYHTLGSVCHAIGEYSQALLHLEKSLDIRRTSLPENHPDLATTYNTIGSIHMSMGQYSQALTFFEQCLHIYRQTLPPTHPSIAEAFKNLGSVHASMGEYVKALEYHHKALEIQCHVMPNNHPDLATLYNNVGIVYNSMGDYAEALEYFKKTIQIQRIALRPDHPSLANTYSYLGWVSFSMKNYEDALSFYKKSLQIRKVSLPHNHPSLGRTYNYIGDVHAAMNHYGFALDYYKDALKIQEKVLPLNHPSLGETYYSVASMHQSTGDHASAVTYYEKALQIQEEVLAPTHPQLATTYSDYGYLLCCIKKHEKSSYYVKKALDIQLKSLPSNHPSLAKSQYFMAMILKKLEKQEEAALYAKKAVEIISQRMTPDMDQKEKYVELLNDLVGLSMHETKGKTNRITHESIYAAFLLTDKPDETHLMKILQDFTVDDPIESVSIDRCTTAYYSNPQVKNIIIELSNMSSEKIDRLLEEFSSTSNIESIYLVGTPPTSKTERDQFFRRYPKISIFSADEEEVAVYWLLDTVNYFRRSGNEFKKSKDIDAARTYYEKATTSYKRLQSFIEKTS